MAADVNVRVRVQGAKQAEQELNDVGEAGTTAAADTSQAFTGLDSVTGGFVGRLGALRGAIGGVAKGMKTLKGALISTGIGALVVALGSLATYFTSTVEGGGELEKTMGGISGAMEPLKTKAAEAGKGIWEAIKNPSKAWEGFRGSLTSAWNTLKGIGRFIKAALLVRFAQMQQGVIKARIAFAEFTGASEEELKTLNIVLKASEIAIDELKKEAVEAGEEAVQPFIDAANAVGEFFNEMGDAYDQGKLLAEQSIALRNAQRNLKLAFAEGRAELKELNKVADDTTKSTQERVEAAEAAMEIELKLLAQRQAVAAEELRIARARDAMGTTDEETLEHLTDLEVELANIRMESAEVQTGLLTKINSIRKEGIDKIKAEQQAEQDALQATYERQDALEMALLSAQEAEVDAVAKKYDELFVLAEEFGYGEAELTEQRNAELAAINDKYRQQEVDAVEKSEAEKTKIKHASIKAGFDLAAAGLELLTALNESDEEQNEERARKQFKRGKAIQMAGAVMATAQAVIAALAAPPVGLGFPAGLPGAVTAGITGAAQIASIAKQKFPGGGGDGVTADTISTPGTAALVPDTFAPGATTPGIEPEITASPMKAYVVGQDVTNQQQIDTELAHRATL